MPTYVHTDEAGHETERVITEAGSLADLGHAAKANDDASSWSVVDESTPTVEESADGTAAEDGSPPEPAPAGRPPRGPRSRAAATETGGEG